MSVLSSIKILHCFQYKHVYAGASLTSRNMTTSLALYLLFDCFCFFLIN